MLLKKKKIGELEDEIERDDMLKYVEEKKAEFVPCKVSENYLVLYKDQYYRLCEDGTYKIVPKNDILLALKEIIKSKIKKIYQKL